MHPSLPVIPMTLSCGSVPSYIHAKRVLLIWNFRFSNYCIFLEEVYKNTCFFFLASINKCVYNLTNTYPFSICIYRSKFRSQNLFKNVLERVTEREKGRWQESESSFSSARSQSKYWQQLQLGND